MTNFELSVKPPQISSFQINCQYQLYLGVLATSQIVLLIGREIRGDIMWNSGATIELSDGFSEVSC